MQPRPLIVLAVFTSIGLSALARADDTVIEKVIAQQSATIPQAAMDVAFAYYRAHSDEIENRNYVTIIDFTRPSTEKRMHVIDMRSGEVEHLLVAHGRNSGRNYAQRFSNVEGSNMSSLGIYLTAETYIGRNGLSLRLDGMDRTNSNARKRLIVLHGAKYVSEEIIREQGRLGRSLGCPAVPMEVSERIVNQLKGKSVLLIYKSATETAGEGNDDTPDASAHDESR